MRSIRILTQLVCTAILIQPLLGVPIFWFIPWRFPSTTSSSSSGTTSSSTGSNSSSVSVGIGNRVNTSTGLDDYGTNISNVQINVNRVRRSVDTVVNLDGRSANGSFVSIGEHTIRLPANISNLTVNTYLVNGIDGGYFVSADSETFSGNSSAITSPLLTAIRSFKNFLQTLFNPNSG
ncbi:uncharacterized protein LOC131208258 [Anopheles bellator]|uniref:uncharacterized protein LOC131208258 n=1 Tax=Anopheles bellator TaxID=139047 RepID=UPI002649E0CD|nr:uncharacterized protein LOC131208258 [Anopheles bellator]